MAVKLAEIKKNSNLHNIYIVCGHKNYYWPKLLKIRYRQIRSISSKKFFAKKFNKNSEPDIDHEKTWNIKFIV